MATKLSAAKIVSDAGIHMIIANSFEPQILVRLMDAENLGTWFKGQSTKEMQSTGSGEK